MVSYPGLRLAKFGWLLGQFSPMAVYPQDADPTDRVTEASLAVVKVFEAGIHLIQAYQSALAEEPVGGEPVTCADKIPPDQESQT